jgi:hypothetical protein
MATNTSKVRPINLHKKQRWANQGKKQNKVVHSQVHKKKDPPMLVMDGKTGHCHFVPAEEVA